GSLQRFYSLHPPFQMGKGFFVSKPVGAVLAILGLGAVATIIALSVVYVQEKDKNNSNNVSPTDGGAPTTAAPVTTAPPQEPWNRYRLPTSLSPSSYKVTLWPRLTADSSTGLYIFTGESTVNFQCVEETDLILIHSNKLNYTKQDNQLARLSGADAPSIKSSWLELPTQYLVIQLEGKLVKGNTYSLNTMFTGELADDLGGFYRSEYKENGVTKIVATTQMQPTDARKAFPCFDEPAMKANFSITLLHPEGTVALSNGKQIGGSSAVEEGQKVLRTVFQETPKMSTYLLAFIVSEFGFVNNTVDDVLIRIFARKSAIEANQGDYALNKTGDILKFFEGYYGVPYPLPKSADQIALPDFNAGAMENWGLITYRETALLYDPRFSSNSNKERVATIIAHELAHMWFGNLVTLHWWNDLWLNEGFASYVEYLGADRAEPDWNVKDLIVLNDVHRVFAIDALASSHPLSSKPEDIQKPAQISELFDAISYSKGASVLRMLSDFLSEEVFKKGLKTYLETFQFGTAVYTDLWDHLQKAVNSSEVVLGNSVADIMNTWVLQMGFPVVTIDTSTGQVSQRHFLLDLDSNVTTPSPFQYKWIVPINWMKNGTSQKREWLRAETATIDAMKTSQWLLANHNVTGYYRVNYDQGNWEKLLDTLNTSHESIPVINRAQLVDDAFNLARAKIISTELALRTTTYLKNEREFMPWESAIDNLDFFYLMFDRSEVYGPLQTYLRNQVTPLFQHYKNVTKDWTNVPAGHMDQYNQVNAISLACRTGLKECQDLASRWFKDWRDTGNNTIHANLRLTVYCNAIAAGGEAEWNFAWDKFNESTVATEQEKLRSALACTKQPWLINRSYLEYTLDPDRIRKQDATSTIVYIANNVMGQSLAWDFIRARWSYIFTQYGGGSFSFSNLINGVTKRFSSEFELQQLLQFKEDNAEVGFGSGTLALDQSIEKTRANIKWITENKQIVLKWLQEQIK
uniref:Aminopeptidase n=1 Tax=Tetraodon nigroviridis TaxID=99883 RepID=H3CNZ7_TETNG